MAQITYNADNINKLLDYLSKRPYIEVVGLIQMLQVGEAAKEPEDKEE